MTTTRHQPSPPQPVRLCTTCGKPTASPGPHSMPLHLRCQDWSQEAFAFQPSIDALQALLRDLDGACWRVQRLIDAMREGRECWPEGAAHTVRRAWTGHAELRQFVVRRQLSERVRGL